mmetsp:Transcript_58588/g.94642  ORF Transcript_58588/g.94642 Transcript_58588/m.94642 type:complete len:329 (+) Transcript_58588:80-1066(+)
MASESIFNLINQHQSQPAQQRYEDVTVATHSSSVEVQETRGPARKPAPPSRTGAGAMPNMAAFELAHKHMHAEDASTRGPKPRSKPSVPSAKRPELDAVEVARRRQMAQMSGGSMAAAMGGASALDRARAAKANAAAKNTEAVKEQSIINGLMKEQGMTAGMRPAARKPEFSGKPTQALQPGQRNYVQENKETALERAQQRSEASANARAKLQGKTLKNDQGAKGKPAGQIPRYLVERKMEMEVDKMIKDDIERERLAGPKQMPEEERVTTLAELECQREAATRELNLIPPTKHQLIQYQTQIKKLETRLAEIEKAIILFSRKVVYIQ